MRWCFGVDDPGGGGDADGLGAVIEHGFEATQRFLGLLVILTGNDVAERERGEGAEPRVAIGGICFGGGFTDGVADFAEAAGSDELDFGLLGFEAGEKHVGGLFVRNVRPGGERDQMIFEKFGDREGDEGVGAVGVAETGEGGGEFETDPGINFGPARFEQRDGGAIAQHAEDHGNVGADGGIGIAEVIGELAHVRRVAEAIEGVDRGDFYRGDRILVGQLRDDRFEHIDAAPTGGHRGGKANDPFGIAQALFDDILRAIVMERLEGFDAVGAHRRVFRAGFDLEEKDGALERGGANRGGHVGCLTMRRAPNGGERGGKGGEGQGAVGEPKGHGNSKATGAGTTCAAGNPSYRLGDGRTIINTRLEWERLLVA
jgi:hypothetical protein